MFATKNKRRAFLAAAVGSAALVGSMSHPSKADTIKPCSAGAEAGFNIQSFYNSATVVEADGKTWYQFSLTFTVKGGGGIGIEFYGAGGFRIQGLSGSEVPTTVSYWPDPYHADSSVGNVEHVYIWGPGNWCLPTKLLSTAKLYGPNQYHPLPGTAPATGGQKKAPLSTKYIVVGDSFASGEGNPPFNESTICHRSSKSWPYLLAGGDDQRVIRNRACSGARIDALSYSYRGQIPQLQELADLNPGLVLVMVGGNDVGFGRIILDCFALDCASNGRLATAATYVESNLKKQLKKLYHKVRQAVGTGVRVAVVGYPRLFPQNKADRIHCGWLEPTEGDYLNQITADLDAVEREAALAESLQYISTLDALKGHELCSRDSWVYPIGRLPLAYDGHPTQQGQRAIANIVGQAIG